MSPRKRNRMAEFQINEISAVDMPAQAHAKIVIMKRDNAEKAEMKTEGGKQFPASDYAYVPDPESPSTWKLRLTSTPGGDPDPGIVGAAAAALGPGFRGNRVQIPSEDRDAVVARVRSAWRKANPDKEDSEMPSGIQKSSDEFDVCESIAKMYIDPMVGAMSFAEVLDLEMQAKEYYAMMDKVCPLIYAMEDSLKSIAGDRSLDPGQKLNMMRETVEVFMSTIRAKWEGMEEMVYELVGKLEEEPEMAKTIKQLQEENASLIAQLEEAKKASSGEDGNSEELEKLNEQIEKLTADIEKANKERDDAVTKASLSDAEREFYSTLAGDDASEFLKMNAKARSAFIKSAEDTDETLVVKGRTIRKSTVGEDVFEVMKAQQEDMAEARKQAEKDREERLTTQLTKRADDELNHLPGSTDEKVSLLKAVNGLGDEDRGVLDKILKAANEAMGGAFKRLGHNDGKVYPIRKSNANGDADHPFMEKVKAIKKADNLSGTAAMAEARKQYPDEYRDFAGKDDENAA